jgi:hypothetical protein
VFLILFGCVESILPPPVHVCEPPYKGQLDPYCHGVFRIVDLLCPFLFDTQPQRADMAERFNAAFIQGNSPSIRNRLFDTFGRNVQNQLFRVLANQKNLETDASTGKLFVKACFISNQDQKECLPNEEFNIQIEPLGWLPGYLEKCQENFKTETLSVKCLAGRFGPPDCQQKCQPNIECGPQEATCIYRPPLQKQPICQCPAGMIGDACQFSFSETLSSDNRVCFDRGTAALGSSN